MTCKDQLTIVCLGSGRWPDDAKARRGPLRFLARKPEVDSSWVTAARSASERLHVKSVYHYMSSDCLCLLLLLPVILELVNMANLPGEC